ncbi:glycoside hydrolase family 9 protein [Paraflavitalea pollutisoli]|uniref:glycoside hydrolase family 9 protein n=1 Tax=Paraflavitalea pollutisoli TaxID=3034143 RepID=UPI0023ED8552|nr:glycoside hydrolase family 9 protein [Paraflavitalea sp. H1-2-19X]
MKQLTFSCFLLLACLGYSTSLFSQLKIHVNQVGWDIQSPKNAILQTTTQYADTISFHIWNETSQKIVYSGKIGKPQQVEGWEPKQFYYLADFSAVRQPGHYQLRVVLDGAACSSASFQVAEKALARLTIPSIVQYFQHQRANTPQEQASDKQMLLFGSDKTVDVRGGWCDASGDISKYFSHLAYTNFMSPQQTPLVTWSMVNTAETIPQLLGTLKVKDSLEQEALWGADYLMRSLSPEGYFYMTVFSYFKKDPSARRIVGLLANSVTTADYQCAFREGGGMAIAALARVARWKKHGDSTSAQYLAAARRAFAHLLTNNTKYTDDGKENILDDYCALMAATELSITTGEVPYREEARKRASNLNRRQAPGGYFIADDGSRPFWHASDAGLPVVALGRYLAIEKDPVLRNTTLSTIRGWLDYQLAVTYEVSNPFGYARQTFAVRQQQQNGFFIPHENESGWWWQGENARLGSIATALLTGAQWVYNKPADKSRKDSLVALATRQLDWILGSNPYAMCFMYGFGVNNVPYMASMYGHGSGKGGISNGITGKEGQADGSGIDFKQEAAGNEWRWTEQWIPHTAWFLQAVTALAANK